MCLSVIITSNTSFNSGPSISNGKMSITFDNKGVKYVYIKNFFKKTSISSVLQMRPVSYPQLYTDNFNSEYYEIYSLNMFNSSFSYHKNDVGIEHVVLRHLPSVSVTRVKSKSYHRFINMLSCIEEKCNIMTLDNIIILCSYDEKYCTGTLINSYNGDVKIMGDSYDSYYQILNSKEFIIYTSIVTTNDHNDPYNQVVRNLININATANFHTDIHNNEWKNLWEHKNNIITKYNTDVSINTMLYYLYTSINYDYNSVGPMGLTNSDYNGHIFWDADIWIIPALLKNGDIKLAKSHVIYRYKGLDEAKKNAKNYGYKGAMYPWESANNYENTPMFSLNGIYEIHVSGCVSYIMYEYYKYCKSIKYLKNIAYPVIKNVADFWVSRVDKNYGINNVIGPDEYGINVNNNAFTNGIAKYSLHIAIECSIILNLNFSGAWNDTLNNIKIPIKNGIILQHDSYNGENIKQADAVLLLIEPFNVILDKKIDIRKNLDYYSEKIDVNGPMMTNSIFSIAYASIGDCKKSIKFFLKYKKNIIEPFYLLSETINSKNPYFLTGAGATLQNYIYILNKCDIISQMVTNYK